MKAAIQKPLGAAMAAAATLTGKRFGLLVASSVVATSAIVASAMTGAGNSGALAALIGRSLASNNTPVATAPAPGGAPSGAGSSASTPSGSASSAGGPLASPEPAPAPAASGPVSGPAPKEPAPAPTAPEAEVGPVKHVFVISLTSPGYEQSLGAQSQMPYLAATLRPQGELLSNYSLLGEAGLPNQIAAIGGQSPNAATTAGCSTYAEFPPTAKASANGVVSGAGCVYPVETLTLADQLGSSQLTWRAYVDGMVDPATGSPANCVHPGPEEVETVVPGGYTARQNPFVYFHSLLDLGDCSTNDLPLEQLTADLRKAEKTPSFSFIAPTLCNSGATGQCPVGGTEGPVSADAFLSTWVPKILASPAYKADGLLIVDFAAANPPAATPEGVPPPAGDPLRVGALLLSQFVAPGSTDAAPYDPYSILRSSEDLFGLDPLGLAAAAKTRSFAPGLLEGNGGD